MKIEMSGARRYPYLGPVRTIYSGPLVTRFLTSDDANLRYMFFMYYNKDLTNDFFYFVQHFRSNDDKI